MSDHEHHHDEHEHEDIVVTMTDEDGNEREMVLAFTFDVEEQVYAVLLDYNDPEEEGVIMRLEEEDGDTVLVNIEDDEEWERVVSIYNELAEQEQD